MTHPLRVEARDYRETQKLVLFMNRMVIFIGAIIVAILATVACIYYATSGHYHILVTHDYTSGHPTHAVLFGAIAVICIIAALVMRPKSTAQ
jgi:hypothetical protein